MKKAIELKKISDAGYIECPSCKNEHIPEPSENKLWPVYNDTPICWHCLYRMDIELYKKVFGSKDLPQKHFN